MEHLTNCKYTQWPKEEESLKPKSIESLKVELEVKSNKMNKLNKILPLPRKEPEYTVICSCKHEMKRMK